MNLAVIPARGGSKRIPKKNIKSFCGKPIIAYSIEAAIKTGLFDHIIVSTDDEKIAEVAKQYGAEVPFQRPKSLADDFTGTNAVAKHAIQWFQEQKSEIQFVCCIYATAPFVQEYDLHQGYDLLIQSGKSFTFSVTTFPFPIQRAIRIDSSENVEAFWPENTMLRSQDLEEAYHDAGQFYWGKTKAFLDDEIVFSSVSKAVILPRHRVQDIDTLEDWKRAELMYQALEAEVC